MKTSFHRLIVCLFVLFGFSPAFAQESHKTFVVYFDHDKSAIKPEAERVLNNFLALYDTCSCDTRVTITAHTDSDGSDEYNDALSNRRMDAVVAYLEKHKGEDAIIPITRREAFGEKDPAKPNNSKAGKALNRRVEITFSYTESVKPEPKEEKIVSDIQDLYKMLLPEPDVFCIDNTKDTIITCPKGTIVHIPANAFGRKADAPCTRIELREALDYSDMLLQNLSTDSDEGLLITGGMIEIRAYDEEDKELELTGGKLLTIYFPTDSVLAGAKTYYGDRDDTHQENMHWDGTSNDNNNGRAAGIPGSYWIGCWQGDCGTRCRLFCRIKRFPLGWKGLSDKAQREENRDFRDCQRNLRKRRSEGGRSPGCAEMDNYFLQNGVVPDSALFMRLYKKYMEERGLTTMEEAIESLKKDAKEAAKLQNLSFNMVQSGKMGYINCDFFPGKGLTNLINAEVKLPYARNIDCKLVFTKYKAIMPAGYDGKTYSFANVPSGEEAWLVALMIADDQPYLFLEKVNISKNLPKIGFKKMSAEEIAEALKKLD